MFYEQDIENNIRWGQHHEVMAEASYFIAVAQVYATMSLVKAQEAANQIAVDAPVHCERCGVHL